MISLERYKALLSAPDTRRTLAAAVLGRLPIGVTGLAILLLVQTASGSYARGGAAAASYVGGLALVAPMLGRSIDRHGPRRILLACALVVGPLGVALFVALASPAMAVGFSAGCGSWGPCSSGAPRRCAPGASKVAIVLCFASAFGFLEIGITAYAIERADAAFAGVLLGLMSAGSAFAPALIIQSLLVTKAARPEHSTEAFTWTTSALLAGVGIGLAAGGAMLERWSPSAALAAGAAAAFAAAVGARFLLGR